MPPLAALTTSIAVLAALGTYLTATILPIPVWVTFVAWASFFACNGGRSGFVKSIVANWIGILIATASLLVIAVAPASPLITAISVGIGSGAMIVAAAATRLRYPPAVVFGFASLVSTVFGTGHGATDGSLHNPTLIAMAAMLVGAAFGIASEGLASALTTRATVAAEPG